MKVNMGIVITGNWHIGYFTSLRIHVQFGNHFSHDRRLHNVFV